MYTYRRVNIEVSKVFKKVVKKAFFRVTILYIFSFILDKTGY